MKKVIYLVVAALVSMGVIAPPAAAQGGNVQQLQEALQQARDSVEQAQQYIQSPEGQQALEDARSSLQQAIDNAQEYIQSPEGQQRLQEARDNAQAKVEQAQQYMQSPEGQQALQEAQDNLQQAGQQLQQLREGVQEAMQEVTSKMERTALVKSGGFAPDGSVILPAAALLLGSGVLVYSVLRRRG
jgi:DNA repair ATPase RecN